MRKRLASILLSCVLCMVATAQQSPGRPLPDSSKCRRGATRARISQLLNLMKTSSSQIQNRTGAGAARLSSHWRS